MSNSAIAKRALEVQKVKKSGYNRGDLFIWKESTWRVVEPLVSGYRLVGAAESEKAGEPNFISHSEILIYLAKKQFIHKPNPDLEQDQKLTARQAEFYSHGIVDVSQLSDTGYHNLLRRLQVIGLLDEYRIRFNDQRTSRGFYEEAIQDFIEPKLKEQSYIAYLGQHKNGPFALPSRKGTKTVGDRYPTNKIEVQYQKPPCAQSLQSWDSEWKAWGKNKLALADISFKCGTFEKEFPRFIKRAMWKAGQFFFTKECDSFASAYRKLRALVLNAQKHVPFEERHPEPTSYDFEKIIDLVPAAEQLAMSKGSKAAIKEYRLQDPAPLATMVGQRVQMDEWRIHFAVELRNSGLWSLFYRHLSEKLKKEVLVCRPVLSIAIDQATRVVLGMRMSMQPDTTLALDTLQDCFLDKSERAAQAGCISLWNHATAIDELWTDNGAAYVSKRFINATTTLSQLKGTTTKGVGYLRGTIERIFKTVEYYVEGYAGGATRANPFVDPDYIHQIHACITVEEIAQLFVRTVVDVYHNIPHGGLGGRTPNEQWQLLSNDREIQLPDAREFTIAFGLKQNRKLDRFGLQYTWVKYSSKQLYQYFYDEGPHDLPIIVNPQNVGQAFAKFRGAWHEVRPYNYKDFWGITQKSFLDGVAYVNSENHARDELNALVYLEAIYDMGRDAEVTRERNALTAASITIQEIEHLQQLVHLDGVFDPHRPDDEDISKNLFDEDSCFPVANKTEGNAFKYSENGHVEASEMFPDNVGQGTDKGGPDRDDSNDSLQDLDETEPSEVSAAGEPVEMLSQPEHSNLEIDDPFGLIDD